ncbi:MAG: diguanylate cyclase [Acidimicrobiia bacterium]|nr:diguanylate cyclase [Acidimicrobiia bacterium]
MNQRLVPLGLGALGLILGVVGAIADVSALGVAAGVLALLAGASVLITAPTPTATPPVPSPTDIGAPVKAADEKAEVVAPPPPVVRPVEPVALATRTESGPVSVPGPSLLDPETGLFNEEYFYSTVETRVSAARRHLRPVAVVLFEVAEDIGTAPHPADSVAVAAGIRETLREADIACRLHDGRFGFVLEDTPEDGAIWTIERLRRKLNDIGTEQVRWAGISCYPAHAFSAAEVLSKAERAHTAAKEWAQDRIEVAGAD